MESDLVPNKQTFGLFNLILFLIKEGKIESDLVIPPECKSPNI